MLSHLRAQKNVVVEPPSPPQKKNFSFLQQTFPERANGETSGGNVFLNTISEALFPRHPSF